MTQLVNKALDRPAALSYLVALVLALPLVFVSSPGSGGSVADWPIELVFIYNWVAISAGLFLFVILFVILIRHYWHE